MKEKHKTCKWCGKEFTVKSTSQKATCSKDCANKLREQTCLKKYGTLNVRQNEAIKEKAAKTNLEKYGSTTYLTSTEGKKKIAEINLEKWGTDKPATSAVVQEKIRNSMMEKYGVNYYTEAKDFRSKCVATSLKHYGTISPTQSPEVKAKIKQTFIRNWGVDNPSKNPEVIQKIHNTFMKKYGTQAVVHIPEIKEKIIKTTMERYGVPYGVMTPQAKNHSGAISQTNLKFIELLEQLEHLSATPEFHIGSKGYDIRINGTNILIEIDPSYTHSLVKNHWGGCIDMEYHIRKTELAQQHGYQCYHVFDWDNPKVFIKSLIKRYQIPQKDCILKELDFEETQTFIQKFSLYKYNSSKIINIGFVRNDKIVELMSFSLVNDIAYIIGICSKFHYTVEQGYAAILERFLNEYAIKEVRGKVDRAKSNGDILKSLNFGLLEVQKPEIIWSRNKSAISNRYILDTTTLSDDVIWSMMIENKYLPVPSCGYEIYNLIV